jgi:hypothetical protein
MHDRFERESDMNDRASLEELVVIDEGIYNARRSLRALPVFTTCRNGCGEPPLPGGGFCCPECRDEFEQASRMDVIQGKKRPL